MDSCRLFTIQLIAAGSLQFSGYLEALYNSVDSWRLFTIQWIAAGSYTGLDMITALNRLLTSFCCEVKFEWSYASARKYTFNDFDVSLTVYLSKNLANDQLDAQILIHLLQSSTCTCVEQYLAHPQEVKSY